MSDLLNNVGDLKDEDKRKGKALEVRKVLWICFDFQLIQFFAVIYVRNVGCEMNLLNTVEKCT